MSKSISMVFAGLATAALAVSPALAAKVEKVADKNITVGGKTYEISNSRTKISIKGAAGKRESIKAGMDCTVSGSPGGEASAITCK
jgi:hypothetical protein